MSDERDFSGWMSAWDPEDDMPEDRWPLAAVLVVAPLVGVAGWAAIYWLCATVLEVMAS